MARIQGVRPLKDIQIDIEAIDLATNPIARKARQVLSELKTRATSFPTSLTRVSDVSGDLEVTEDMHLLDQTLDATVQSLVEDEDNSQLLEALMRSAATKTPLSKPDEFALMSLIAQIYDQRCKDFKEQVRTYLDLRQEEVNKIAENVASQGLWTAVGTVGSMVLKTWGATASMASKAEISSDLGLSRIGSFADARRVLLFETKAELVARAVPGAAAQHIGNFGLIPRLDKTLKMLILKTTTIHGSEKLRREAAKAIYEAWGDSAKAGAEWKKQDQERMRLLYQVATDRYKQFMDMAHQDEMNSRREADKVKGEIDQTTSKRDQSHHSVVQGIRGN